MTTDKENEKMLNRIESRHECCGKPMICLRDVEDISPDIDNRERWICLECGGFFEIIEGQMSIEDLLNKINSYGTYTDKRKFVELHPELSNEVI